MFIASDPSRSWHSLVFDARRGVVGSSAAARPPESRSATRGNGTAEPGEKHHVPARIDLDAVFDLKRRLLVTMSLLSRETRLPERAPVVRARPGTGQGPPGLIGIGTVGPRWGAPSRCPRWS